MQLGKAIFEGKGKCINCHGGAETTNASALRDPNGKVIGAIGILRDMREYEQVVRDLEKSKNELRELRNVIRRAVVLASDVIEPEHMSLFASDASPAIALRGQPAPVGPSLKEIAEAAAADADDPSGAPGHRGKQEHSGPDTSEPTTRPCTSR